MESSRLLTFHTFTIQFLYVAGHLVDDSHLSTGHSTLTTALCTYKQTMVMTFRHSFRRPDVGIIVLFIMLTVNRWSNLATLPSSNPPIHPPPAHGLRPPHLHLASHTQTWKTVHHLA